MQTDNTNKLRYKITTNNAGEVLTMYTQASTEAQALRNATAQLAARLHISMSAAKQRMGRPNATSVVVIKDRD